MLNIVNWNDCKLSKLPNLCDFCKTDVRYIELRIGIQIKLIEKKNRIFCKKLISFLSFFFFFRFMCLGIIH